MPTQKTRKSKGIAKAGSRSRAITKTSKRPIKIGIGTRRRRNSR